MTSGTKIAEETMTAGKLAKAVGINQETIRYYEREGLMPQPYRSSAGYRLYDHEDGDRLRFIARSKRLGFTLKETKSLLKLCDDEDTACRELCESAREKAIEIEAKIAELAQMRDTLRAMVDDCVCGKKTIRRCSVAAFLTSKE